MNTSNLKKEITPTIKLSKAKVGLHKGETRATFIVNELNLHKIKAIAYWERSTIKDTVNCAFELLIKQFEEANGTVKLQLN